VLVAAQIPRNLERIELMFCEETVTPVRTTAHTFGRGELVREARSLAEENLAILWPGRQLGPYRLIERLGQGGQGEVWKSRRVEPQGELVALKILKPELAHNPTRMAQFRREAQRGARLTGKSLVAAYELSQIDGFHCMAMPFVRGTALRDVIKWRVAFISGEETEHLHPFVSLPEAEYYVAITAALAEAAMALSEVHEKRIAHRDIKPANLQLDNRWG
jgi:serine/threonine protein kinase